MVFFNNTQNMNMVHRYHFCIFFAPHAENISTEPKFVVCSNHMMVYLAFANICNKCLEVNCPNQHKPLKIMINKAAAF